MGVAERTGEAYERHLEASREAKRRRKGTCVDCGGPTSYAGKGDAAVSLRCRVCGPRYNGERARGTGPSQRMILEELERAGRITRQRILELGIQRDSVSPLIASLMRNGQIVRVGRGIYERGAS